MNKYITYRKGYKYQLAVSAKFMVGGATEIVAPDSFLHLDTFGVLTIRQGYAWDGCSGAIDTRKTMRASLLHDALYQLIRLRLLPESSKDKADLLYRDQLLKDGVSKFRAYYHWKAVSTFGTSATLPSHQKPLLRSP